MDDCEIIVEDGEITDSEEEEDEDEQNGIETYKVLERPTEIMNLHRLPPQEIISDEEFDNSSSDSDSDTGFAKKAKRSKLKKLPPPKTNQNKFKKYDIWSKRAQEDAITESLVTCDVSKIDRSLGVESYDYTRSNRYKDNNRKRRHDQKSVHLRLGKRDDKDDDETKGNARKILDLIEDSESSMESLAKDIANKLMEEKDDLILKIVKAIGKEKSIALFKKTQEIEEDGGMLIMNGTRRRTPGGVYIFLLKRDDDITKAQQNEIFFEEKQHFKQIKKQREKEKLKKLRNKTKILGGGKKLKDLPSRIDAALKDSDTVNNDIVPNPPPSPASEDSNAIQNTSDRSINNYSDEFLDLGTGNDMDLF